MAAQYKMQIHQTYVTTAFLNANLKEEIYMRQPEGYVVEGQKDKVLKLNKSLYGLKQAPLEWNERINEVLLSLKFTRNRAEYCIYSRKTEDSFVIIALYVDDLLIAGTTIKAIEEVKKGLMNSFKMKDLGKVGKFLGMIINQNENCDVKLSLSDFITKMLKEFGMSDCKAEKTPFYSNSSLNEINDEQQNYENVLQYRMLVGKLLFASNTVRFDFDPNCWSFIKVLAESKGYTYGNCQTCFKIFERNNRIWYQVRLQTRKFNQRILA